jgi:hypothetical protein
MPQAAILIRSRPLESAAARRRSGGGSLLTHRACGAADFRAGSGRPAAAGGSGSVGKAAGL